MAGLISHPFRLTPSGAVATVPQESDQYRAEQLAMIVLTRPGERPLVPDLGLADPVFVGFDGSTLQQQADAFGPSVTILAVRTEPVGETTQDVQVEFE